MRTISHNGGGGVYTSTHGANAYSDAVAALLLVAPAPLVAGKDEGFDGPLAIIVPACDCDLIDQGGQHFNEASGLAPNQRAWATSFWLEQANHNAFNAILESDFAEQRWTFRPIDPGRDR